MLENKKCLPHKELVALTQEEIKDYFSQLKEGWDFLESNKITKEFTFEDFKQAMGFVNKVAILAEVEGHHSDITIQYNKVEITLWTHFLHGLSENDFIVAAKIDQVVY